MKIKIFYITKLKAEYYLFRYYILYDNCGNKIFKSKYIYNYHVLRLEINIRFPDIKVIDNSFI